MQQADVPPPNTTAFGLRVPLPTPVADSTAGLDIHSFAAPSPPGAPAPTRAATVFHTSEHMPFEHNFSRKEPHTGMTGGGLSVTSVPFSGLAPPPGLDLPEPPAATPSSGFERHHITKGPPQMAAEPMGMVGRFLEAEADMATLPSTHFSPPLPHNAETANATINGGNTACRGIEGNSNDNVDHVVAQAKEPLTAADIEDVRPAMGSGVGTAWATSAETLKAALQTAASAGLVMEDPTVESSLATEEETPQEENGPPPAQLLMTTLQLGDEDLTELLRLALEDQPWLRTPVIEALSALKPSRRTDAMAPLHRDSLAASTQLVESSC